MNLIPIKRALLSVSDKTNLIPLAQTLVQMGCEIISTGGTRKQLDEAGISSIEISTVTGNPEAFGGRMKTISFHIESALLFDREKDAQEAMDLGIAPIDLVVCNLYPFKKVLEQGGSFEELIENIDIGGPTMIRAAAKNFKYVTVLVDPTDYPSFIEESKSNAAVSLPFRQKMMAKAFNHCADYDAMIAVEMDKALGQHSVRLAFDQGMSLRYGENSHQKAWFFREKKDTNSLFDFEILHGKELSFNNIMDINSALEALKGLDNSACSVVKHNNPCGLASGENQKDIIAYAWGGDSISAFGSIIAFNRPLELETAKFFQLDHENKSMRKFIEVIIAPAFSPEALTYLQQHKNLRIIRFDGQQLNQPLDYRFLNGSLLVQDTDQILMQDAKSVTGQNFDLDAHQDLVRFGLSAIRAIKSNSIVLVRRINNHLQLLGMGAGQPNRLIATKLAIDKAKENLKDLSEEERKEQLSAAVMVSDAFFPFEDNVELAAAEGIRNIVQPGGSIRDPQIIETCNRYQIAMIFTGIRHFKH